MVLHRQVSRVEVHCALVAVHGDVWAVYGAVLVLWWGGDMDGCIGGWVMDGCVRVAGLVEVGSSNKAEYTDIILMDENVVIYPSLSPLSARKKIYISPMMRAPL